MPCFCAPANRARFRPNRGAICASRRQFTGSLRTGSRLPFRVSDQASHLSFVGPEISSLLSSRAVDQPPLASEARPAPRLKNPWLWAVVAGLVLIPLMRPFLRFEPAPPPVLLELPSFELTDQSGAAFGSADLAGDVYIANFIFTRCASVCPMLTQSMKLLRKRFDENQVQGIRTISFSVDPEHDTPAVLDDYARSRGIDQENWRLLTGDLERVKRIVIEGFKTPIGDTRRLGESLIDIAHTGQFVLVDRLGGVRGYYGVDEAGLDEIFFRSQHVLADRSRRAR